MKGITMEMETEFIQKIEKRGMPKEVQEEQGKGITMSIGRDKQQASEYNLKVQEKMIIETIEQANKKLGSSDKEFNFSIHEKTKQIIVKIVDKQTKETVREIPPEKILDMVATMCEMAGLFVDQKK